MLPAGVPLGLRPATTPTGMPPGTVIFSDSGEVSFDHTIRVKTPVSGTMFFNRYRLDRVLGRGGMGVVWLADDLKLERPVALKFLPSLLGLDAAAVKELKTETRRGLELSHPNIVRIYDFVDDEELAAISMEFVDGKTLSELRLTTEHGVFSVPQVMQWLPGVVAALDYAHFHRKLVHRDLKPANIMATTKDNVAKIADFGIARSLSDTMSRLSASQAGASGTLPYMSPQQAMGERPMPTDDVYSLGATIYELLSGKPPFYRGDISTQITSKVPSSMIERREELEIRANDSIPKEWETAIAMCLRKDASQRPQSAGALAEMLGLPHGGATKTFVPKTAPMVAVPSPRSSRMPLYAAAVVLLGGGAAAYHFLQPHTPAVAHADGRDTAPKTAAAPTPPDTAPPALAAAAQSASPAGKPPPPKVVAEPPPVTATVADAPPSPMAVPAPPPAGPGPENTPAPIVTAAPPAPASASAPETAPAIAAVPPAVAAPLPVTSAPPMSTAVPDGTAAAPGSVPASAQPPLAATPPSPGMVQPMVGDPPNGHWPLAMLFPTPPQAAYSESGRRHLLYEVQKLLREKDLYSSTQDGKEGKGTHNAILIFQAKNGLVPNGLLDGPTLLAMDLSSLPDNTDWKAPAVASPSSTPSAPTYRRRSTVPVKEEPGFLERAGKSVHKFFRGD